MGQGGPGLLSAALGLGGLLGAIFAMTSLSSDRLIRNEIVGLVFWGAPLAVIGIFPFTEVALAAMVVIGVSNATYDVALFTILQRAYAQRGPGAGPVRPRGRHRARRGHRQPAGPGPAVVFGTRGAMVAAGAILPLFADPDVPRIGQMRRITVVDEGVVELLRKVPRSPSCR